MSLQAVLVPLFVQVALTFGLLFWMGGARVASIRRGDVKVRDIALGQQGWPERETQIGNCFHNQMQVPVLFYAVVTLALIARKADLVFVVMVWLFVLSRLVHAYVHVTSNHVPKRFQAFLAGAVVLLLMWVLLALRVLTGL